MAKSIIEIIDETVAYYKENPRGLNDSGVLCVYYNEKTKAMCAVGRCAIDPKKLEAYSYSVDENIDKYLKEEYREHDFRFWSDLQHFHDNSGISKNGTLETIGSKEDFWEKAPKGNTLTKTGEEAVKYLKETYD